MKRWKGLALGTLALLLMSAQPTQAAEEAAPATRMTMADLKAARAEARSQAQADRAAAKQAQQKIKSLNYAAAIEEVSTDKGKIYRVKTGVFPSRAEAAAAAAKLKANGLGGIVLEQK